LCEQDVIAGASSMESGERQANERNAGRQEKRFSGLHNNHSFVRWTEPGRAA
jgi:hypothetical protein